MLTIDRLRYRWPGMANDCLAIEHLQLDAGQRVFIHGPSGAGKSTLLGLLAGVLVPQGGSVTLNGTAWSQLSGARRDAYRADHLGYIFQQFNVLSYLSVLDNVMLPCRFSSMRRERTERSDRSIADSARTLLEQVDLPESLWERPAGTLSVGQQQRVAAARALIGSPEVIIADEPTSALDASLRDSFMALLLAKCIDANTTLVFVSHDERLADRFDRRVSLAELNRVGTQAEANACAPF